MAAGFLSMLEPLACRCCEPLPDAAPETLRDIISIGGLCLPPFVSEVTESARTAGGG